MDLNKFTDLLLEGGKAVGEVSRVSKENVEPTIEAFNRQILQKLGIENFKKIGSTGKKSSSGDLDIAVELPKDLDYKEVHSQLQQMGFETSKASPTTISVKFPVYSSKGKTDEWAQIDMMFGKTDWLEFGYYAPGEGESQYSGAHRNFLLAAIIRYAREMKGKEGKTWAIDLNKGLNRKTRGTKTTKTGKEKEVVLAKTLITQRPEKVVELLNLATDGDWELSDLKAPFEHLWQKTKKSFPKDVLDKIRIYVSGASKSSKKEEPVMEQLVKRLTTEVLNEGSSMREKFYLKKTNGKDLYKIYQHLSEKLIKKLGSPNNTKTHEHLRIAFPNKYDIDKLEKFVKSLNAKNLDLDIDFRFSDLEVEMISPNSTDPDSPKPTKVFSGKYPTYKIYSENDDFYFYITDSNEEGKLKQNMVDPSGLNMESKTYETFSDSMSAAENEVKGLKKRYKEARDFMLHLLDNVSSVDNSKPYKLSFDEEMEEKASKHLEVIYKNFGEILAALVYQKNVGGVLSFPKGNEPVIDFQLDEIEYSVKYEKGAAGVAGEIINKYGGVQEIIDKLKEEDISIDDSDRFKFVLETIADKDNNNSAINIKIAGELYDDIYKPFKEFMGDESLDYEKFDKGNVKSLIEDRFEEIRNDENLDLEEELRNLHKKLSYRPQKFSKVLNSEMAYGLVTYPITARVANRLNKDNDLIEKWKRTLNNLYKTYQIRTRIKGSSIVFEEKAFNDIEKKDVEFVPGGSAGSPEHQKLRATYK